MAWRPARSITVWHDQLKRTFPRAAPPATSSLSWGTVGDAAHDPTSDHTPHNFAGWGNEIVTAADAPHAPALGLDDGKVTEAMRVSRDPRIKYMIFNRRIFSSYSSSSGRSAWQWGGYSGTNPHGDHMHLSVVGDSRADGTQLWKIGASMADTWGEPGSHSEVAMWRLEALAGLRSAIGGGPEVGKPVQLVIAIKDLLARAPVTLSPEQMEHLVTAVAAKLEGKLPTEAQLIAAAREGAQQAEDS